MEIPILAEEFLRQGLYLRNWSPKTLRTYRQGLTAFQTCLDPLDPPLRKSHLQAFMVSMRERGLTPGGCNMYCRTINSFLSWLREEGHLEEALRIRLLSNPPKAFHSFSDTDIRRIVARRPSGRTETRTWTLFVCLVDTGLRIDEALGLEQSRVDFDGLSVTVRGKGNRERTVPISLECRKALFRLTAKRPGRYVFATTSGERLTYRNAYRDLKTLCGRVGVEGSHVHPHNVRHYFAVTFLRAGGDLYRLSRILGHSSINTTQIYLRSMNLDHLREGHARYSPLERARA